MNVFRSGDVERPHVSLRSFGRGYDSTVLDRSSSRRRPPLAVTL